MQMRGRGKGENSSRRVLRLKWVVDKTERFPTIAELIVSDERSMGLLLNNYTRVNTHRGRILVFFSHANSFQSRTVLLIALRNRPSGGTSLVEERN